MPRIRLNLSVPPALGKRIEAIAHRYGFTSSCEMTVTLLSVFAAHVDRAEAEATRRQEEETDQQFLARTFEEFATTIRQPDGTVPVIHPHRDIR